MENNIHKKPYDFKVGSTDNDGNSIVKIYSSTKDFVVFRTDNAIKVDIDDESVNLDDYFDRHTDFSFDLGRINSWLPNDLQKTEGINKQIARAMTTNLVGKADLAKKILNHAEERVINLRIIAGRLEYTASAFTLAILTIIFSITIQYQMILKEYHILSNVIACGALGGILSIAIGFKRLDIDIDANRLTNFLVGISRILISAIAAIFAYFAIKSNIAFSIFNHQSEAYGIYIISMIAGFVEMLIPNMMNNLASKNTHLSESNES